MSREELLRWAFERLGVADRAPARIAARSNPGSDDDGDDSNSSWGLRGNDDDDGDGDVFLGSEDEDGVHPHEFGTADLWKWVLYYLAKQGMLRNEFVYGVREAVNGDDAPRVMPITDPNRVIVVFDSQGERGECRRGDLLRLRAYRHVTNGPVDISITLRVLNILLDKAESASLAEAIEVLRAACQLQGDAVRALDAYIEWCMRTGASPVVALIDQELLRLRNTRTAPDDVRDFFAAVEYDNGINETRRSLEASIGRAAARLHAHTLMYPGQIVTVTFVPEWTRDLYDPTTDGTDPFAIFPDEGALHFAQHLATMRTVLDSVRQLRVYMDDVYTLGSRMACQLLGVRMPGVRRLGMSYHATDSDDLRAKRMVGVVSGMIHEFPRLEALAIGATTPGSTLYARLDTTLDICLRNPALTEVAIVGGDVGAMADDDTIEDSPQGVPQQGIIAVTVPQNDDDEPLSRNMCKLIRRVFAEDSATQLLVLHTGHVFLGFEDLAKAVAEAHHGTLLVHIGADTEALMATPPLDDATEEPLEYFDPDAIIMPESWWADGNRLEFGDDEDIDYNGRVQLYRLVLAMCRALIAGGNAIEFVAPNDLGDFRISGAAKNLREYWQERIAADPSAADILRPYINVVDRLVRIVAEPYAVGMTTEEAELERPDGLDYAAAREYVDCAVHDRASDAAARCIEGAQRALKNADPRAAAMVGPFFRWAQHLSGAARARYLGDCVRHLLTTYRARINVHAAQALVRQFLAFAGRGYEAEYARRAALGLAVLRDVFPAERQDALLHAVDVDRNAVRAVGSDDDTRVVRLVFANGGEAEIPRSAAMRSGTLRNLLEANLDSDDNADYPVIPIAVGNGDSVFIALGLEPVADDHPLALLDDALAVANYLDVGVAIPNIVAAFVRRFAHDPDMGIRDRQTNTEIVEINDVSARPKRGRLPPDMQPIDIDDDGVDNDPDDANAWSANKRVEGGLDDVMFLDSDDE